MNAVTGSMAALLSACSTCRLWVEQEEGPYHRDAQPLRRNIVEPALLDVTPDGDGYLAATCLVVPSPGGPHE